MQKGTACSVFALLTHSGRGMSSRFIWPFRQFFLQATDAPFEYGEAAALMALSSIALGRRWLEYGNGIKPNLFLMLAGASSVARKSTCVNYTKKLIQEVDDARVGPRDYTVEGLIRWMQEKDPQTNRVRNKVVLFAEEFGADLARMEAYAGTTATDFCALYDGEGFEKVRAKGGVTRIDKPRVSLFAACAYPMLQRYLKPKDWLNGYLMRFVYVTPMTMREKFLIQPQPPQHLWKQASIALKILRDDLQRMHYGMSLDPQAIALFTHAITQFDAHADTTANIAQTYKARFGVNILKLAMLYQIDEDPNAPVGYNAMQNAMQFAFTTCWPSFQSAYRKTAMGDFEGLFFEILHVLQQPTSRLNLAQIFFGNEKLTATVEYAKAHGLVRSYKHNGSEMLQATTQLPTL